MVCCYQAKTTFCTGTKKNIRDASTAAAAGFIFYIVPTVYCICDI